MESAEMTNFECYICHKQFEPLLIENHIFGCEQKWEMDQL